MDLPIFLLWRIWDTILLLALTGAVWVYLGREGDTRRNALIAATAMWMAVFATLWLGLYDMNLATLQTVAVALSRSWVEMAVVGLVVLWGRRTV